MGSRPSPQQHILATGERSPELAREVIDALFVFVAVLSRDGALEEANAAPLKAAGVTLEEVRGKHLWDLYWWNYGTAVQAQLRSACERAAQGETVRFDTAVRTARDARTPIDFQVAPLRTLSGVVSHLVASAVDITQRKQAEDELREKDQRKDAFISALAHELRNPLAPIPNALEILARVGSPDPRAVRAREVISRQVAHLVGLVDELLDIARIGRGTMQLNVQVCDLCSIAVQTAEDYREPLEAAGCTLEYARLPSRFSCGPTRSEWGRWCATFCRTHSGLPAALA
jgi:PAS domain S-box-containing protein